MKFGRSYTMQLTINDENNGVSIFRCTFTTDILPTGGLFYSNNYIGTELLTIFKLSAPYWYDPKDVSLPLTYQFGYYVQGRTYFLNLRNESSTFYTTLPVGNPLTVFVRIYDIYGSYSEATDKLTVRSGSKDPLAMINNLAYLLTLNWTDPGLLPGIVSSLSLYTNSTSVTYNDIYSAFNVSLTAIKTFIKTLNTADFSTIDILLNMINITANYEISSNNKIAAFGTLGNINQLISDYSIIMSTGRCDAFVNILNSVVSFNYLTVTDDPSGLYQVNEALKALVVASSQSMGQGQDMFFGSSSIISYFKLFIGSSARNFTTPLGFNASFVSLPLSSALVYDSSVTILAILTAYNSLPNLYNTTKEYSGGVEFSYVMIVNSTQVYLNLDLRPYVINVTIPIWNLKKTPRCGYLDGSSWSNTGCTFAYLLGNNSVCSCTHMSLYSSGTNLGPGFGSDLNPSFIVIYIVCIVALLWLILALWLVVKDRKEAESKVFVEKVFAALPPTGKKAPAYIPNEIADQLGKPKWEEEKLTEKDSDYSPSNKVGVIGAYFDKKPHPESADEPFKMSDSRNLRGNESQNIKVDTSIKNFLTGPGIYEEMKETDIEAEEKGRYNPSKIGPIEEYGRDYDVLPHSEITKKVHKAKAETLEERKSFGPKMSLKTVDLDQSNRFNSIKGLESDKKDNFKNQKIDEIESKNKKSKLEGTNQIKKLVTLEIDPENDAINDRKQSVLDTKVNKDKNLEDSKAEKRNKKFIGSEVKPQNLLSDDKNQLETPKEDEKYGENTNLFTMPESPRQMTHFRRKKHEDQEIQNFEEEPYSKYSSWIVDYYFSALLFYHSNYTRFSRSAQGICSFYITTILIGSIIGGMGTDYADTKGNTLNSQSSTLEFQDVAISFSMVFISNFLVGILLYFLFFRRPINQHLTESEKEKIDYDNRKRTRIGIGIVIFIIVATIIAVALVEMNMNRSGSILWVICMFIAFLFDFFFIQLIKVLIYNYPFGEIILPSN